MEKYDVVAMGELLIDFTQNGYSEQGIRFLKLIREEPHVMCLPCYKSWEGKRLLLV